MCIEMKGTALLKADKKVRDGREDKGGERVE